MPIKFRGRREVAIVLTAVILMSLTTVVMPSAASGNQNHSTGELTTDASSGRPAAVFPSPPKGPSSDVIVGGGGGSLTVSSIVPYFAPPQGSSLCGDTGPNNCQEGWSNLIANGIGSGSGNGVVKYVVINVCTLDGTTLTGPGCQNGTYQFGNTWNQTWTVGNGPANWLTTIEHLQAAGITPVLYLNTQFDQNSNPNDCGASGASPCNYAESDIATEESFAAYWWCGLNSARTHCATASPYQITSFYFDNMSLDTTDGITTTGSNACTPSDAGVSGGSLYCNETYYDQILEHAEALPLGGAGSTILNARNWALNPNTANVIGAGYSSWDGNASTCTLGEHGSSCGEDWLMYLDALSESPAPIISWQGSEAQLDCNLNVTYCASGTYDGVLVGSLPRSAFPSWLTDGSLLFPSYSYIATSETTQAGDVGVNENGWLDNEMQTAINAGFGYAYETDESDGLFGSLAVLADSDWNDVLATAPNAGYAATPSSIACPATEPTSVPNDPSESTLTLRSSANFQGTFGSTLPTNWEYFGGFPGAVSDSYWLDGIADSWDVPTYGFELNPNGDNAVTQDSFGADLGNDLTHSGVLGTGGILDSTDLISPGSAVEWCERVLNNVPSLHSVAVLWPKNPPTVTNITGVYNSTSMETTATVTASGDTYLQVGDPVQIYTPSGSSDSCYETVPYGSTGVQVATVTPDQTQFTVVLPTNCTATYGDDASIETWPPEVDMVETSGGTGFNFYYHWGILNSTCSLADSSINLQNFNVFELVWTTSGGLTFYVNGLSLGSINSSTCAGVVLPHVPLTFDFDQEDTGNYTPIGNSNQQSDLAWEARFS